MTNQKILESAVKKAIGNDWIPSIESGLSPFLTRGLDWKLTKYGMVYFTVKNYISSTHLIFNQDFAKALWGNRLVIHDKWYSNPFVDKDSEPDIVKTAEAWKHHLQEMVVSDDPIKYLGENL